MSIDHRRDELGRFIDRRVKVWVWTHAAYDPSDDSGVYVGYVREVDEHTVTLHPDVVVRLDEIARHDVVRSRSASPDLWEQPAELV